MAGDAKIAILAVQETHLSEERREEVEHPANGSGARGVAFVLNKRLTKGMEHEWVEVIPGPRRTISILNVYAPNAPRENEAFWKTLRESIRGRVDIILGDWNVTGESMDRLPMTTDDAAAVHALAALISDLEMVDGWRSENPRERAYTYLQLATGSQSRIDRIYVRREMVRDANDWAIEEPGIPTDHRMISVTIADYQAPFVGKGRWAMPEHLLNDKVIKEAMKDEARKLAAELNHGTPRTERSNAQTAFQAFKMRLTVKIRERAKAKIPKARRELDRLQGQVEAMLKACVKTLRENIT
ncbi:DNase I-like protein [Trametes coccinea BRFM310]|uniref:DNase I-like protein n=1 Tax=Trametes coccinea (strain BRFM310) TaxID=1353009 RepID=A0A1Y2J1H4_TRAC3|nr:DNase I-like protein [Trametes coccinea BRFM310]